MNLIEQLKIDEGFRGQPYKCSAGKTTIGYGRNLEAHPLTKQEAELLLVNDIRRAVRECEKLPYFQKLNQNRRNVISNMVFNLGMTRFKQFKRLEKALIKQDFIEASKQMLDSKWARQVGVRAQRLAKAMVEG
jgi:lysozyme